uniref:NADH-ubiquinone oxidoreductase chain 4L n=1 Tax=Pyrhila pisum TaxID=1550678 RepID=A0A165TXC0_PYRPS|nr:NADH dehydrogenase subunit 4L [Pyrhila pisum]AMY96227.1 NADH dehydrogenase subunit 4L [Pyrhila pisum]
MLNFSVISMMGALLMIFCGLLSLISYSKHFLNSLLSLEFCMLGVFWLLGCMLLGVGTEVYFCLIFLSLVACEGALGLALLVLVVRTHGNDRYSSISLLEC